MGLCRQDGTEEEAQASRTGTPHPAAKSSKSQIFVGYLPQRNILVPKVSEGEVASQRYGVNARTQYIYTIYIAKVA